PAARGGRRPRSPAPAATADPIADEVAVADPGAPDAEGGVLGRGRAGVAATGPGRPAPAGLATDPGADAAGPAGAPGPAGGPARTRARRRRRAAAKARVRVTGDDTQTDTTGEASEAS